MGYEDFCWFVLAEEDKSNPLALEYWFRVVDLDGDGALRARECAFFYEEQLQRMECLNQEPVLWEDVLCQMSDMLRPERGGVITMRDLRRCKLAGNFFNVLFNLNKFIAFESRDPFSIRREREEPHLTEWDRFARAVRAAVHGGGGGRGGGRRLGRHRGRRERVVVLNGKRYVVHTVVVIHASGISQTTYEGT